MSANKEEDRKSAARQSLISALASLNTAMQNCTELGQGYEINLLDVTRIDDSVGHLLGSISFPSEPDKMEEVDKRIKQKILDTIDDLVTNFVFYDRKEGSLSIDTLNSAVQRKVITTEEMVAHFAKRLKDCSFL